VDLDHDGQIGAWTHAARDQSLSIDPDIRVAVAQLNRTPDGARRDIGTPLSSGLVLSSRVAQRRLSQGGASARRS
jgi:hypothetical protein